MGTRVLRLLPDIGLIRRPSGDSVDPASARDDRAYSDEVTDGLARITVEDQEVLGDGMPQKAVRGPAPAP
jgi:hypothetical protein